MNWRGLSKLRDHKRAWYIACSVSVLLLALSTMAVPTAHAAAPLLATDLIGQLDDDGLPSWTTSYTDSRRGMPYDGGFYWISDIKIDYTHHRMYVSDQTYSNVIVFNLADNNQLVDRVPDHILGQPAWNDNTPRTTQDGQRATNGLAIDEAGQRLFVADQNNNRVLVYDTTSISDGMPAAHVLGQPNFITSNAAVTQTGMNQPRSLAYDAAHNKLYVGEYAGARVLVFDTSTIVDGQAAQFILGKPTFTDIAACTLSASNLCSAHGLAHDDNGQRLFVADITGRRVLVYNTTSISNGMAASYVLGQPDFVSTGGTVSDTRMLNPTQLEYDNAHSRLIVSDFARVLFYDVSTITNGEAATAELGQPSFTATEGPIVDAQHVYFSIGTAFNPATNELFVADRQNHRVLLFDIATITNGENATNVYGQTDGDGTPAFTAHNNANDNYSSFGLSTPCGVAIDPVHHRMFVSNQFDDMIKMYALNSANMPLDYKADAELGGPDMFNNYDETNPEANLFWPGSLAYDAERNWLFVADTWNYRVLVFDAATIDNGEDALYVIGQPDFVTRDNGVPGNTFEDMLGGLDYDPVHKRLFVADQYGDRVLIFDMTHPANGMTPSYVLGQSNLDTTSSILPDAAGLWWPSDVAYDPNHNRLYVADSRDDRIMAFDMSSPANGMNASYVLGQTDLATYDYTDISQTSTQDVLSLSYDSTSDYLWVGDDDFRTTGFDTSDLHNNMPATIVLGQPDFTSGTRGLSQSAFGNPFDVTADSTTGNVYVSDFENDRVLIYRTPRVTLANPPAGTKGQAYSWTVTTSGTQGASNLSVVSGQLPAGLSLNSAGFMTGTPTASGTYTFSVRLSDDNSTAGTASHTKAFTITINDAQQQTGAGDSATQTTIVPSPPTTTTTQTAATATTQTDGNTADSQAPSEPTTTDTNTNNVVTATSIETAPVLNEDGAFGSEEGAVHVMTPGTVIAFTLPGTTTGGTAPADSTEKHSVTIDAVTDNYVDLTIASDPIKLRLSLEQSKDVDVDQNGSNDLRVTLLGIVNRQAQLSFKQLKQSATQTQPATGNHSSKLPLTIGVGCVIIVALGMIIVLSRRKHRYQASPTIIIEP